MYTKIYKVRVDVELKYRGETMVDLTITTVIVFLISLIISAIIIYIVTKLLREKEGFGTALLAAFVGAIIYAVIYYFLPNYGWVASVVGGITWLIALRALYKIGWLKALVIAVIVWILAAIVGFFLPTIVGPL